MNLDFKQSIIKLDNELSKRFIGLDAAGYFIIYLDTEAKQICAKHYTNIINEKGLALDPQTGEVIPTKGKITRASDTLYCARTAKELCIKIFEESDNHLISKLEHAAYLGREFVRAEIALIEGYDYIQD
jgi:dihydropteroate synthase